MGQGAALIDFPRPVQYFAGAPRGPRFVGGGRERTESMVTMADVAVLRQDFLTVPEDEI